MKVRFCGGGDDITGFTHGKVYELVKAYKIKPNKSENGEVAVVDNTGDWYTYFIDFFEPVDDDAKDLTGEDAPPIIEFRTMTKNIKNSSMQRACVVTTSSANTVYGCITGKAEGSASALPVYTAV